MNKKLFFKFHKGFATLLIVIILGSVALSLALLLSTSGRWSMGSTLDTTIAHQAKALVNSCAETALEVLRENNSYTGTNTVTLDNETCTYQVTDTGGTARSIDASGTVSGITRRVIITTNSFNPLVISSWQETP